MWCFRLQAIWQYHAKNVGDSVKGSTGKKPMTTKLPSVDTVLGLDDTWQMAVGRRDTISFMSYMSCCFDVHAAMITVDHMPRQKQK